jgi:methionyl-tRNA formyltransferase
VNIVYLTTEDPLYLPSFFERVFSANHSTAAVVAVRPLYGNQTVLDAVRRYVSTFGLRAAYGLARRTVGAKVRRRSIRSVCDRHGVSYQKAADLNDAAGLAIVRRLSPDVIVSVSCPQIFRQPLIELPPRGCLNIHGAVLPQYRGVLPSFWMLANGETTAGVSIFFVNDEIDGGELCGQRNFEIRDDDTLDTLLRRSKSVAADLLLEVLAQIEQGTVARRPLDLHEGSYFSWPTRDAVSRFTARGRRLW